MFTVSVHNKKFKLLYPFSQILQVIRQIAVKLNKDYKNSDSPVFISVLNGAFMFTGDLMKEIDFQASISFIKVASYFGEQSSGEIKELIGLNEDLKGKDVIILEDIIDTGFTVEYIYDQLMKLNPNSVKIVSLFYKKDAYQGNLKIDYTGISIPDKFILGYGLDYNGLGRNYKDVYELSE